MTRHEVLERLAGTDLTPFRVKLLGLFGSVASGEATTASDVDFLVEFDGPATFDRYIDLEFFLEDLLGASVDLVTRSSLPPALRRSVEKDIHYVAGLPPIPR